MLDGLKYKVRKIWEVIYFFWTRNYQRPYYDEDKHKYVYLDHKDSCNFGKDNMLDWYDGEHTILNFLRMKVEYMFYKLKKDGNQLYWYVDAYEFLNEKATDSDREWAYNYILNKMTSQEDHYPIDVLNGRSSILLWSEENEISESGKINYYLVYEKGKFKVVIKTYKILQPDEIPENKKTYTYDFKTRTSKEAVQYRVKDEKEVLELNSDGSIIEQLRNFKPELSESLVNGMITYFQSMEITPKDYVQFSDYIKSVSRGLRKQLTDLLHFRHLILKLYELSEDYSDIDNISDDEMAEYFKKARFDFIEKRKALYHELSDFFIENAESWWD